MADTNGGGRLGAAPDLTGVLPAVSGSSDPYARTEQTFPRLTGDQVERVAAFGVVEDLAAGTALFEIGEHGVDFFLVLAGHVEIYDIGPDGEARVMTVHGEHQFTGELDLFNDRTILVGGRMGVDGRVARLDRARFRRMLAAEPDVAETIMRAFILRRAGFISHGQAAVTVIGSRRDPDRVRIARFLSRNGHPYLTVDTDIADAQEAFDRLARHGLSGPETPAVLCGDGTVLVRPGNHELGERLGISEPLDADVVVDVAVVGAGPAGLAAAVYAASEGLSTVVLEAEAPGGQAGTSSRIENYLGFPTGISGQDLAARAQVQAQKFGARIAVPRKVKGLDVHERPYSLRLGGGESVRAHAVVVATGARYRRLDGVADAQRFEGNGIHYAATAIEAALTEGEPVVVVGGGNSAGQAVVFLSRTAAHVHLLIRGPELAAGMSDYLVGRIEAAPERITVHTRTEITAMDGGRHLETVTWVHRGEERTQPITGVFLMLGAVPNTEWLDGAVALDAKGFVCTGNAVPRSPEDDLSPGPLESSRPGVFAVGDVRADSVKRVASGVGEGSVVVASVHRHLARAR